MLACTCVCYQCRRRSRSRRKRRRRRRRKQLLHFIHFMFLFFRSEINFCLFHFCNSCVLLAFMSVITCWGAGGWERKYDFGLCCYLLLPAANCCFFHTRDRVPKNTCYFLNKFPLLLPPLLTLNFFFSVQLCL